MKMTKREANQQELRNVHWVKRGRYLIKNNRIKEDNVLMRTDVKRQTPNALGGLLCTKLRWLGGYPLTCGQLYPKWKKG